MHVQVSCNLLGLADDMAPIHACLGVIVGISAIAFVVWIISVGVSQGMKSANSHPPRKDSATPPPPTRAFPVVAIQAEDGPGKFCVSGVDRQSAMDVTEYITAESPANARVKAELRGIVVTKIERV